MIALVVIPVWVLFSAIPVIYNVFPIQLTNTIAVVYAFFFRLVFILPFYLVLHFVSNFKKKENQEKISKKSIEMKESKPQKIFLNSTPQDVPKKFMDSFFLVISRLSLSFLMVHFFVLWWGFLQFRFLVYFSFFNIVSILFSVFGFLFCFLKLDFVWNVIYGFVLYFNFIVLPVH